MRLPVESAHKTAFREKMQSASYRKFKAALRNAPRAREEQIDEGPNQMTVEYKDRGTLVASKTIIYGLAQVSEVIYMVNPDYLPGGSMARQAKFPEGKEMSAEDMAEYLAKGGNPEAGKEWKENHDKHKDVVKDKNKKAFQRLLPIERKAAQTIGSGKNGYIAMYKRQKVEVMADSKYEAQQMAAKHAMDSIKPSATRNPWKL